jgi:hypothetical protein
MRPLPSTFSVQYHSFYHCQIWQHLQQERQHMAEMCIDWLWSMNTQTHLAKLLVERTQMRIRQYSKNTAC